MDRRRPMSFRHLSIAERARAPRCANGNWGRAIGYPGYPPQFLWLLHLVQRCLFPRAFSRWPVWMPTTSRSLQAVAAEARRWATALHEPRIGTVSQQAPE